MLVAWIISQMMWYLCETTSIQGMHNPSYDGWAVYKAVILI
jgi:hypothetical protein